MVPVLWPEIRGGGRNLKIEDAIKEMRNNPAKKFETNHRKGQYIQLDELTKNIKWHKPDEWFPINEESGPMLSLYNAMDWEWEEVKEPVTWQEALQAWSENKTVIRRHKNSTGIESRYNIGTNRFLTISENDTTENVEWYIED